MSERRREPLSHGERPDADRGEKGVGAPLDPAVTLTTSRDVARNAPFSARRGFRVLARLSPGLAAIRAQERAIGDDAFAARVAMRKELSADPPSPPAAGAPT